MTENTPFLSIQGALRQILDANNRHDGTREAQSEYERTVLGILAALCISSTAAALSANLATSQDGPDD